MAGKSATLDIDEVAAGLPRRIHDVVADHVADAPSRTALIEDGAAWSYLRERELARCLLGDRAAARQAAKFQQRIQLT